MTCKTQVTPRRVEVFHLMGKVYYRVNEIEIGSKISHCFAFFAPRRRGGWVGLECRKRSGRPDRSLHVEPFTCYSVATPSNPETNIYLQTAVLPGEWKCDNFSILCINPSTNVASVESGDDFEVFVTKFNHAPP